MTTVTGLFRDQDSAERAYLSATQAGYSASDINVIMSQETRERYYGKQATLETEVGNKAAEGLRWAVRLAPQLGRLRQL
jgi:hypothetical protein